MKTFIKRIILDEVELKKIRSKLKLTLKELSELTKIHISELSRIENGAPMSENSWKKIEKAINKVNKKNNNIIKL